MVWTMAEQSGVGAPLHQDGAPLARHTPAPERGDWLPGKRTHGFAHQLCPGWRGPSELPSDPLASSAVPARPQKTSRLQSSGLPRSPHVGLGGRLYF